MRIFVESTVRVGGAILFGAVLIGGAFFMQGRSTDMPQEAATIVTRGDVRTTQQTTDRDGDGIPDWEEALRGTDPDTFTTIAEATTTEATAETIYTPPETLTDRFAQDFLEDIIRTGAGREMSQEEQAALVENALGTLSVNTKTPLYTQADITITRDNSLAALRQYGNVVAEILEHRSVPTENELVLLYRATTEENAEPLETLGTVRDAYQHMAQDLLKTPAPSNLARVHVDLINALTVLGDNVAAMAQTLEDPLRALVHARRHPDDATNLFYALDNVRTELERRGVVYTQEEPGIFLFSLRP